jgi:DNA polymerase-3 subunit epsilon/CBS domain-containing protein
MRQRYPVATGGTPLRSLTAVALDTETTSLDVRRGRIIEIGAIGLANGRLLPDLHFSSLVNPQEPIPPESTAIHGITDKDVKPADGFPSVYKRYRDYAGAHVVLGYALSFDFAMLRREHERAGLTWSPPQFLDVRDLVRSLQPDLPNDSLETVATWLGIDVVDRHRALPDAKLTAEVFLALLPRLRDRSIRTLAEAVGVCRKLASSRPESGAAEWHDAASPKAAPVRADSYPYRHRAKDVMSAPPMFAGPSLSVREALALLVANKVSSLFIARDDPGAPHGIVTERDILRAIDRDGDAAFDKPVRSIATFPLESVSESDFLYVAFGRMRRKRYRHMGVVGPEGELVGAITQRDLVRLQADEALAFADALEDAVSIEELALVWRKLARAVRTLVHEEVDARDIAAIISGEVRSLTARAAAIAEREVSAASPRPPALRFAVMVLGSGGRGESLLALDQDNATVFEADDQAEAGAWLLKFGQRMNAVLDEIGVPLCKGGVMAGNAAWCKSARQWREQVSHWLGRSGPQDILNADIFFDAAPVYGEQNLAIDLRADAIAAASRSTVFLQIMSLNAAKVQTPINWLGRFKLDEDGRMDLKKHGIMPIFSAARVLALRHRLPHRATAGRLDALRGRPDIAEDCVDGLLEAHQILLRQILLQQLADIEHGVPLSNRVDPGTLGYSERVRLKWALEQVPLVNNLLGDPVG